MFSFTFEKLRALSFVDMAASLKQKALKGVAMAALGAALFGATNANAALPLEGVTLEAAFSVAPPFVVVSNSFEQPSGIDIDITKELQRRTGFSLKNGGVQIMNFGDLMNLASKGDVQIAGGAITLSSSRAKVFDFSGRTVGSRMVIVARKDSNITGFDSLNNRHIATEAGTVAEDLIPEDANIHVTLDECPTNFMAIYRVSRGLSDAVIVDEPLIQFYIDNWANSNLEIKYVVPDSDSNLGLLFQKNTKASKALQAAYRDMERDGTIKSIINKYLPSYNYVAPQD